MSEYIPFYEMTDAELIKTCDEVITRYGELNEDIAYELLERFEALVNKTKPATDIATIIFTRCSHYLDGGTAEYKTSDRKGYFLDNRIGTLTKEMWYDGYPNYGNLITDQDLIIQLNLARKAFDKRDSK